MTPFNSIVEQESRFLLQTYRRYPVAIESGRGCYIFDTAGKRYLDVITGVGVHALGYGHPRIQAVLLDQAQRSIHTSNLVYHPYQGPLAERLCAMSGLNRAFFTSSGTEAVETALKAARARGRAIHSRKIGVVAVHRGFHGRTFGSLAVTGQPRYQEPFEPLSPGGRLPRTPPESFWSRFSAKAASFRSTTISCGAREKQPRVRTLC
jgi:acetylornithine/N-succinyldiaminopimelate aminotransferase